MNNININNVIVFPDKETIYGKLKRIKLAELTNTKDLEDLGISNIQEIYNDIFILYLTSLLNEILENNKSHLVFDDDKLEELIYTVLEEVPSIAKEQLKFYKDINNND